MEQVLNLSVMTQRVCWDSDQGIVEKTRGYLYADFTFDRDWDGCTITTLWQNSELPDQEAIPVLWEGKPIQVPEQVLVKGKLLISCVGIREGYRVDTYEMSPGIQIHPAGPLIGVLPEPVTPDMIEQLMAAAARAEQAAAEARRVGKELIEAKNRGEFNGKDGVSPTVDVTEIPGGHEVTITDKDGPETFPVMDGRDGKPIERLDTSIDERNHFNLSAVFTDGSHVDAPPLALPATVKAAETPVEITDEKSMQTYYYNLRKSPNRRYQYEIEPGKGQNLIDALGGFPEDVDASAKYFVYVDLPYSEAGGYNIIATLQGHDGNVLRQKRYWGTLNSKWQKTEWLDITKRGGGKGTVRTVNSIAPNDAGNVALEGKDIPNTSVVHVEGETLVFEAAVDVSAALASMDTVIGGGA